MKVIQLKGLDTDLYPLIGPLVMNPKVLKANNNYPFKTTANHQWYIAVNDQEEVMGFLPVENKKSTSVINNYYLKEDDGAILMPCLVLKHKIRNMLSTIWQAKTIRVICTN